MTNITIDDMIKCAEREIGMRERVYPRWVEAKKMSQAKADSEIAIMKAIVEFLKQNKERKAMSKANIDDLFKMENEE